MKKLKLILLLIIIFIILFSKKFIILDFKNMNQTALILAESISKYKTLAPIVFIFLFTIVPLTLFPDSILAISAGIIFGLKFGFLYTMVGALCGGSLAFFIARFLGREFLLKWLKKDFEKLENSIENNSFSIILLLRLIPLFPFDVVSYAAGISSISYKKYFLATFFGTIPGIFVFVNMGRATLDINPQKFYISISLLICLISFSFLLKQKFKLKQ